jgi:hypothetical protein
MDIVVTLLNNSLVAVTQSGTNMICVATVNSSFTITRRTSFTLFEKMGVIKTRVNQQRYVHKPFELMEINQSKSVKPKMRRRKLRSGVNWQGEFEQKGITQRP